MKKSIVTLQLEGLVVVLLFVSLGLDVCAAYERGTYSLTPPKGWERTENPSKTVDVWWVYRGTEYGLIAPHILVVSEHGSYVPDVSDERFEENVECWKKADEQEIPEFKFVGSEIRKINNIRALVYTYTFRDEGGIL